MIDTDACYPHHNRFIQHSNDIPYSTNNQASRQCQQHQTMDLCESGSSAIIPLTNNHHNMCINSIYQQVDQNGCNNRNECMNEQKAPIPESFEAKKKRLQQFETENIFKIQQYIKVRR